MTNQELATTLRKLAEIYDTNPDIPQLHYLTSEYGCEFVFCRNKEQLAQTITAYTNKFHKLEKHSDQNGVWFSPPNLPNLRIYASHADVCQKVVTGTKIVPATEAYTIPAQPEHEEEVFEWVCPESFLGASSE